MIVAPIKLSKFLYKEGVVVMTTATQTKINISDGPGMWSLFIKAFVEGQDQQFTLNISGTSLRIIATIKMIEALNRPSGDWRIQFKIVGTVFSERYHILKTLLDQALENLECKSDDDNLSMVYNTLTRKGEIE